MKVLIINSVCGIGSTGKIVVRLAKEYIKNGDECIVAYGREKAPSECNSFSKRIGTNLSVRINGIKARVLDNEGFNAISDTKKFLKWADEYNPDLIWLHNLHGYYINIELLFYWLKNRKNTKIKWTMHDCWPITGHCAYFSFVNCNKWKTICNNCEQCSKYPKSLFVDNSKRNFIKKKELFTCIDNIEIITPSKWMKGIIEQSYLNKYQITVIRNTIDKEIFKYQKNDFKKKYNLENKTLLLGVANYWDQRKGLDDFIKLSNMLNSNYALVLVGLTKKQIFELENKISNIKFSQKDEKGFYIFNNVCTETTKNINNAKKRQQSIYLIEPKVNNICSILINNVENGKEGIGTLICIERTNNQSELVNLYSSCDYYLHLSYEDNYPTTCLEAKACETSIIAYNCCGNGETLVDTL